MDTQERLHRLEAGQALPQSRRNVGPVVLAEGELLVQGPATWLGGTVVVPPAVRIVAPAVVPEAADVTIVAVRASIVAVREKAPFQAAGTLRGAAAAVRRLVRHLRPAAVA